MIKLPEYISEWLMIPNAFGIPYNDTCDIGDPDEDEYTDDELEISYDPRYPIRMEID